jgi:hypothetical protein
MTRVARFLLASLGFMAFATPVAAENWVSFGSPWFWDDLDSVARNGSLVTWRKLHSAQAGVSPAIAGGVGDAFRVGIDCNTGQWYDEGADGTLSPDEGEPLAGPANREYAHFCGASSTTPPAATFTPPTAAPPSSNPLLAGWHLYDMTASVQRQLGTTDGVVLTDAEGFQYLVATTTAGNRFEVHGRAPCSAGGPYCGALFLASVSFPDETAAQRFVANHRRWTTHALYRTGATVEIVHYLIFDHGITADNLASNVTLFMRAVDEDVVTSRQ